MTAAEEIEGCRISVYGHVQGVNFRVSARRQAERLALTGMVRNEPDGSVAIEVEGTPSALAAFIAWCKQGPPAARVDRVEVSPVEPVGRPGFSISRG